jgi:exosortase
MAEDLSARSRQGEGGRWQRWIPLGGLLVLLAWAYAPLLLILADRWWHDPQYSHGPLVPLFSLYLVWRQREEGVAWWGQPCWSWALALLLIALFLRALAGRLLLHQLDALTLQLSLAAVVLGSGGWLLLRRTAPAIAFLLFMVPLPYELERNVGEPLKLAATVGSTFLLQTLGQPALRDGHIILIDEVRLGVVDACSGLKMLMTFAAFSVGAVLLMRRSRFEKLMVLLGIIPIAIVSNIVRITATGLSHVYVRDPRLVEFLHDFHGWLMMPIGLGLLALELWVLRHLVIEEKAEEPWLQNVLKPTGTVPGVGGEPNRRSETTQRRLEHSTQSADTIGRMVR